MSTQAVTIAIKAKSEGVQQELDKTKKKMDSLNKSAISPEAKNAVNEVKNALGGMGKLGDSLGGTISKIAGGFTSMLNPIGLVTAGITAIITLSVSLYKKLTLSHEEYIAYLNTSLDHAKKKFEELNSSIKTDEGYLERLKTLQQEETLDNAIKSQAIELISILEAKYGSLGVSIDEATGKIIGLDQAMSKINGKNQQERLKQLEEQLRLLHAISLSEIKNYQGALSSSHAGTKQQNAMLDDIEEKKKKLNGNSSPADQEELKRLIKLEETLQKIIAVQGYMKSAENQLALTASDPQQFNKAKEVYSALENELNALQNVYNHLESMGEGSTSRLTRARALSAVQKASEQRVKEYDREYEANHETIRNNLDRYKESRKTLGEKYNALGEKGDELYTKKTDLQKEQKDLIVRLKKLQAQQAILEEKKKQGSITASQSRRLDEVNKQIIDINQTFSKIRAQESKVDKEITDNLLKRQEILDRLNDAHKNAVQALDQELEIQKLILQGKVKEAEKQRIINQLKKQGYDKIEGADIQGKAEEIASKKMALNELNFKNDLRNNLETLQLRANPNKRQAEKEKRIKDYEGKYGKLTDEQKSNVGKIVDLEYSLNKLQQEKTDLSKYEIKTNELTARGGFAEASVSSKKDTINQQIKTQAEKQVKLLNDIKNLMQDIGTI